MAKQPLTASGVNDKRDELYELPTLELALEADAVEADCKDWILENFSLTTAQEEYLDEIDEGALKYYGQQLAMCFRHLLVFTLVYPPPPPSYSGGKWVEEKNTIEVNVDDNGDVEVTGDVTFTMVYRS